MYINESNLDIYINEFVKLLKKYKEKNKLTTIETDILNDINIKLLNKQLECNIITEILKNDKNKENFSQEIKNKVISSIIQKYVEEFQLEKKFDELLNSLEKQGEGTYNIITDEEQISLLIEIISNHTSVPILIGKHPITFAKLNYNISKLNKGNFDMNKSKSMIMDIQQNIIDKTNWITNIINDMFIDKNSGNLDTEKINNYYKKIKETLDNKFTNKEKDLFYIIINDKKEFDIVFSLILSSFNNKIQNECKNISLEDKINFEKILKDEVSKFNNDRTNFILKFILNKLKSKFKKSGTNIIENVTNNDITVVKKKLIENGKECLNNPENCKEAISGVIDKGKEILNIFSKLKGK